MGFLIDENEHVTFYTTVEFVRPLLNIGPENMPTFSELFARPHVRRTASTILASNSLNIYMSFGPVPEKKVAKLHRRTNIHFILLYHNITYL